MEAKRRRLDEGDSCGSSPHSDGATESFSSDLNELTLNELQSRNPPIILQALTRLKSSLRNKAAIEQFMHQRTPEIFSIVVDLLLKSAADIGNKATMWMAVLKESISVIANCCTYSTAACLKIAAQRIAFSNIAVRVLESGIVKKECKTSMARLIANMCLHKEPALCIASNPSLVDRLVLMFEADASTATQALRAIRGLIASTCFKVVLLSNTGFHLGKMLVSGRNTGDVVEALTALARRRVRDTGRQVAGSDCAERLLELFFDDGVCGAKELVLMLCEGSTDMRERMGEAGAIQRIIESANDSTFNCKLLAAFSQEAWGRAALRESGALDFLISRLSSTPFRSRDRLTIVQPLHHFVHDTSGMAYLVRNRVFVDTVVKDVTEFIAESKIVCEPEIIPDEEQYRPDSPLLMEIESGLQKKGDFEDSSRLHKDYASLWAYTTPSPSRSLRSSPMYSLPSSGGGSPVSLSTVSSVTSPYSGQSCLSDLESADTDDVKPEVVNVDIGNGRTVIESELWLLTWQAQEDANLPYLNREDVVNGVLSYLALIPSPDYRIGRILRRLASCRPFIDSLLSMQFHTRVLHTLCIVPCRVIRYSKRCARCERTAEFGREILRVFSAHVDSDFGDSFLIKRLSSKDFTTRVVAAIAKIALIRDRLRLGRISSGQLPALDLLFESLHFLLTKENFLEICDETTYREGPPVCAQIVGAISTLIPPQRLREMLEIDAAVRPQKRGECMIEKYLISNDANVEMLVFETKDGEVLARVPKEAICESSRYFQGMFSSNLLEKCTGRRSFLFSPEDEDCSAEDFTRFLHHLAGCRSACSAVKSPQTCVALVKLSDRYLCPELSESVCGPHGPARRLLTGETLSVFLPAVLTTQTHERLVAMCVLTLIRYCTSSLIVSALRSICHSRLLVDSFIEHMKRLTTS